MNSNTLVRTSDPETSKKAAARTAAKLNAFRRAVLVLVREEPLTIGSELNRLYQLRYERREWPAAKYDTPRKRLSTLHDMGLVEPVGVKDGERQWMITEAGLQVIA